MRISWPWCAACFVPSYGQKLRWFPSTVRACRLSSVTIRWWDKIDNEEDNKAIAHDQRCASTSWSTYGDCDRREYPCIHSSLTMWISLADTWFQDDYRMFPGRFQDVVFIQCVESLWELKGQQEAISLPGDQITWSRQEKSGRKEQLFVQWMTDDLWERRPLY
jgi:hypothetical protein